MPNQVRLNSIKNLDDECAASNTELEVGAFGEQRQMVILCGSAQPREAKSLTTVSLQLFYT